MKRFTYKLGALLALIVYCNMVMANNVDISNVTVSGSSSISFTISWENSWRVSTPPYNHDAVWVFVKRRDCASNIWYHVDLNATSANHSAGSPLEVYIDNKDAGTYAKGIFLRRSTDGVGNISNVQVTLDMEGIPLGDHDFKVMGVEMVNIPRDSFYLGDGSSTGRLKDGSTNNPYYVTSEAGITAGSNGISAHSGTSYPVLSTSADFPKGFAEVYCMKYEITQGQYIDFINMITQDQKNNRFQSPTSATANFRYNPAGSWPSIQANMPFIAMNYLAWTDLIAYLDWSCLRPMTEFEFEKICRGPVYPVAFEYPWGNQTATVVNANTGGLVNVGQITEAHGGSGIGPINAVANSSGASGIPFRVGYAATGSTDRIHSGATYYGVMNMGGNMQEQVVSASHSNGVAYVGELGDGFISQTPSPGYANETSWPSKTANITTSNVVGGRARKGSTSVDVLDRARVSDRALVNYQPNQRSPSFGGRGVR